MRADEAVLVTATFELQEDVAAALSLRDSIGILSVYVGIDPVAEATVRPRWEIEVEAGIQRLRERLRAEAPRSERLAFDACIRSMGGHLAALVDSTEHGRGRALFAAVAAGEVQTMFAQVPFATEVAFGPVPRVLPLLAVDDGHPVGLVTVGRERVRALDVRLGVVSQLACIDVEPVVDQGPERKGPAAANPLRAQHVVVQRERYERHVEADHRRRLRRASERVGEIAHERRWELAVLAGDPRGTRPALTVLEGAGAQVEIVERDLDIEPSSRLLAELEPAIAALQRRRDLALVESARAGAASGGNGAIGLADVLGVLPEGRVAHLLLARGAQLSGTVGPRGELAPVGVVLPGLSSSELRTEPLLGDRMALQALETGARVTVVGDEGASMLADADGVAALLRW